jgi:hypothetical protein
MSNINLAYWDVPMNYDVKRQASRPENFSFLYRRTLFVGLNMVSNIADGECGRSDPPFFIFVRFHSFFVLSRFRPPLTIAISYDFFCTEWETSIRLQDNIEWVIGNVEAYWESVDVVFLMGYGRLLDAENAPFYEAIASKANAEWSDRLIVYARRASMTKSDVVGGNENFIELRVGAEWPIIEVSVRTKGKDDADAPVMEYREVVLATEDEDEDDDADADVDADNDKEENV